MQAGRKAVVVALMAVGAMLSPFVGSPAKAATSGQCFVYEIGGDHWVRCRLAPGTPADHLLVGVGASCTENLPECEFLHGLAEDVCGRIDDNVPTFQCTNGSWATPPGGS